MLLRPSYLELMKKLNEISDDGNKINSPYLVVVILAKCARKISKDISDDIEDSKNKDIRAISEAIKKLYAGEIKLRLKKK